MSGLGAAPLDAHAGAGLHERAVTAFVGFGEQPADRHVECLGQRVQRPERRRDAAVLDLRKHAGRNTGRGAEVGDGQVDRLAQPPHLEADAGLERAGPRFARRRRTGPQLGIRIRFRPARWASGDAMPDRATCLGLDRSAMFLPARARKSPDRRFGIFRPGAEPPIYKFPREKKRCLGVDRRVIQRTPSRAATTPDARAFADVRHCRICSSKTARSNPSSAALLGGHARHHVRPRAGFGGLCRLRRRAPGAIKLTVRGPPRLRFRRPRSAASKRAARRSRMSCTTPTSSSPCRSADEAGRAGGARRHVANVTVVGSGRRMEIFKEVGRPDEVAERFGLDAHGRHAMRSATPAWRPNPR